MGKRSNGQDGKAFILRLTLAAATLAALPAAAQDAPDVAVSVKPLHSLVAAVMLGVGEPKLIVGGAASPHTYNMKPSNAEELQQAKVVFWLGPHFEQFLTAPLQSLANGAEIVALQDAPSLMKLPFREGGAFDPHDDGDDHEHEGAEHQDEGETDLHLWLDPRNADAMVRVIRDTLAEADPSHADQYTANAKALQANLAALDTELQLSLAPVQDKPFIVFHDAYQYFEKRYGLRVAGSITVSPETPPGAARVREIHDKIGLLGATCVFAEPQFEPKLLQVVMEGSNARSGTLDPEGSTLKEGPDLYFTLLRSLSTSLNACLGGK